MPDVRGLSLSELHLWEILKMMKFAAVIACAGISSRMRDFKPLMRVFEKTVIENIIDSLGEAGIEEIVVVTGYKAELIAEHLRGKNVKICVNQQYLTTKMFDSLKIGIQALTSNYDGVFLTPGDVPLVAPETIRAMEDAQGRIVIPSCRERTGHPVLISKNAIEKIVAYEGSDGLRGALRKMQDKTSLVPVDDVGILLDADTPKEFAALRKEAIRRKSKGTLWPEIKISIAKYNTLLTPETAQLLELIENTGSIQTASGCMHMAYSHAWKKLNAMEKEIGYKLTERFPGGTSGGGSQLTEKGKRLLKAYQEYLDEVRQYAETLFYEKFTKDLRE